MNNIIFPIFLLTFYINIAFSNPTFDDIFLVGESTTEISELENFFFDLLELDSGKKIVQKLYELINGGNNQKIKLKLSEKSAYNSRANCLEFNIIEMQTKFIGCVIRKRTKDGRYEIGKSKNPPHIVLGHELIHVLDHWMNPKYSKGFVYTGKLWSGLDRRGVIPADKYSKLDTIFLLDANLWAKDIEQRAVIGTENQDWESAFTEFMLRIDAGLPPRYAYQPADNNFYEDAEIIERIMLRHLGSLWEVKFLATNPEENSEFDVTVARESRYSYQSPDTSPRSRIK